jgi:nucleoside-diphosphate-sugar epimerase
MSSAIIGSGGFIGSALKRYADTFLNEEWIGITRDNYSRWAEYKKWNKVVWAGGMSSKLECNKNHDTCWTENVDNLRDAINDFTCEKFIYLSSYDVYAPCLINPKEEDAQSLSDDYVSSLSWYGKTKIAGEQVVKIWDKKYLVARCNGFVGEGLKKNVVYDLAQPNPQLFVSWDSKFQYMHTDTFAKILFSLTDIEDNKTINVTSPDILTPIDIAWLLRTNIKKVTMPTDKVVPKVDAVMDVTKMEQILNKLGMQLPSSREAILNWSKPLY